MLLAKESNMTSEERHEQRYQRRKAERLRKHQEKFEKCNVLEDVFTVSNLYHAYRMCKLGVGWKASTQKYKSNALYNVVMKKKQLVDQKKYNYTKFYEFDIFERGKARHIRSVHITERVAQRCFCDESLVPVLSNTMIWDCGASLKNKGVDFQLKRMDTHLHRYYRENKTNKGYILVFDFSGYFDNIDHDIAMSELIGKYLSNENLVEYAEKSIRSFGDKGLGLGSQTSQITAVAYPTKLDHMIKEELGIKFYGRYMDDGYLLHKSKKYLQYCLKKIREMCKKLGIKLNEKKTKIKKIEKGFVFLKRKFSLTETGAVVKRLCRTSITRMRRKLKKFKKKLDEGKMNFDGIKASFNSWLSYAYKTKSYKTRQHMKNLFYKLFNTKVEVNGYVV